MLSRFCTNHSFVLWYPSCIPKQLDETWLCSSPDVEGVTGKYFVYQNERSAARSAYDSNERRRMWSMIFDLAPDAAKMWQFDWLQEEQEDANSKRSSER
jgi:hypothetical protein